MDSKTNIPSFTVSLRGYDRVEVDEYLDSLAESLGHVDDAHEQNRRLQAHIVRLNSRIKDLEDRISADTPRTGAILGERIGILLRSAEETASDTLERAEARAAQVVAEAEQRLAEAEESARVTVAGGQEQARRIEAAARAEAAEIISEAEARAAARTRQIEQWAEQVVSHTRAEEARMLREQQEKRETALADLRAIGEQRDAVAATLAELRETLGQALGLVVPVAPADGPAANSRAADGPAALDGAPSDASAVDLREAGEDGDAPGARAGSFRVDDYGPPTGALAVDLREADEDGSEAGATAAADDRTGDFPGADEHRLETMAGPAHGEPRRHDLATAIAGAGPEGVGAEPTSNPPADPEDTAGLTEPASNPPADPEDTAAPAAPADGAPEIWRPSPTASRAPFDGEAQDEPVTDQIEAVRADSDAGAADGRPFDDEDDGWAPDHHGMATSASDDPEFEAKLEAWVSEGARHFKRG